MERNVFSNFKNELKRSLLLYAVTDRSWTGERTLLEQIESALVGGVTAVQLREKFLSKAELVQEARAVKELCARFNVPLFINDFVDVANLVDADGAHVGQSDSETSEARASLGNARVLGVSVQTVEQALLAESRGADYLGVGAVFSTQTKADAEKVETSTLRAICDAVKIPVVAIGGITLENMELLADTGVSGVAVVSAIFAQSDVELATWRLRERADALFGADV